MQKKILTTKIANVLIEKIVLIIRIFLIKYYMIIKDKLKLLKRNIRQIVFSLLYFGYTHHPKEGLKMLKNKIRLYFFLNPKIKKKYLSEIDFILRNSDVNFSYSFVFPYPFIYDYKHKNINVYWDENKKLYYVIHNFRKLYYSKNYNSISKVKIAYLCTIIEQDKSSPHRYLDNEFIRIKKADIVVDVGAAEGNLFLDYINDIKELHLFEANILWREALEATYEPWKEKVYIYSNYVSNNDNEKNVRLDTLFGNKKIDFIKIDVEGTELKILSGAINLLEKYHPNLAICTYHSKQDEKNISNFLSTLYYKYASSKGFMLFTLNKIEPPYFRRGLIRATFDK